MRSCVGRVFMPSSVFNGVRLALPAITRIVFSLYLKVSEICLFLHNDNHSNYNCIFSYIQAVYYVVSYLFFIHKNQRTHVSRPLTFTACLLSCHLSFLGLDHFFDHITADRTVLCRG